MGRAQEPLGPCPSDKVNLFAAPVLCSFLGPPLLLGCQVPCGSPISTVHPISLPMAEELTGNLLVAQHGSLTSALNASLAGVVTEALNHGEIEEIYGALRGVQGLLQEEIIDLAEESQQTIRGLRHTPGAALGTTRYQSTKDQDIERLVQVCEAHNVRYFLSIGDLDAMSLSAKVHDMAVAKGYALRVIGIPKSFGNALSVTDH